MKDSNTESVSKEELRKAAVDASVFAQAAQAVASAASTAYVDFDETTGDVEWCVKEYEKLAHKEG